MRTALTSKLLWLAILAGTASTGHAVVVDVAPERGRAAAAITFTDETGRARALSEFAGFPLVLLPIYTRCRGACVDNVGQLQKALAESSADPRQFRVLLFSFDNTDTPQVLRRYREREHIPLGWSVGGASPSAIDALMNSIGFQYGKAGSEFAHPNVVMFLDSRLRIAKWIYGTDYSSRDVDAALKVAAGGNDWIGRHADVLYALLLFGASLLCVALGYTVMQWRLHRRHALPA